MSAPNTAIGVPSNSVRVSRFATRFKLGAPGNRQQLEFNFPNGRLFRKLRLFHIDGEFFPVVCHLDKVWNVHGGNRKTIMRGDETLMAEEKSFLNDWKSYVGAANVDRIETVAERTGLEFFGMDFTIDADGSLFIYELNPAMRHSFDHARNFPYKLPYDQAIAEAFTRMVSQRMKAIVA